MTSINMETKRYSEDFDLQSHWLVLKRRWLVTVGVFAATVGLVGLATTMQRPSYEANGRVLVQTNRTTSLTGVGEKIGTLEPLRREGNPLDTQAVVVMSYPNLQRVIDTLQLKNGKGRSMTPEELARRLKVEPVPTTDILNVKYNDDDPEMAANVVNLIMKAYIDSNLKTNQEEATKAGGFIENQLPAAQEELNKASEALRNFRTRNGIVDLERESAANIASAATLQDQLSQARAQLADVARQEQAVVNQLGLSLDQAINLASLSQSAGVQEVLSQLQQVETRLVTEQSRFKGTTPQIQTLQQQRDDLNALLQSRVVEAVGANVSVAPGGLQVGDIKRNLAQSLAQLQSQRLGLDSRISMISGLLTNYRSRALETPALIKQEGDLVRQQEIALTAYQNLNARKQEIEVAKNQQVGNARILQNALVPTQPAGQMRLLLLASGAIVGLLLGIAAAFLIDAIDRSLKTVKDAEAQYGYTLLGLVPRFETSDTPTIISPSGDDISPRVIAMTSPRSMIHEAYQMLQANLKFMSLDRKVKTIVVSSAVPREGKSEVTANLAATMAQSGRKVLLVDADMRNPTQHHLWGLVNSVGLSNVVVDQSELRQAVKPITSNLSVLTAGVMPPNPLAILDSEAMTTFLETVAKDYDYVLFDTPPLAGTADAAVLGKMADGVLIAVRPGVADSASVAAAKSLLDRSEPNILGLVANGVNVRYEPDSYFYYTSPREQVSDRGERTRSVLTR
ncbi:polysaccharide biosynthesis tyrosine autokinase [Leptolyngbya sp. DQ-M1]|uniref:GumC family protein n=1 Tax=Leptolyngbya sp. DQ-M1 TaxID=2933920 RepID=UPI0032990212